MSFAVKRNNVKVFGNGDEVMLFAHGFGCDQNMWRFITPAFEDAYKIVQENAMKVWTENKDFLTLLKQNDLILEKLGEKKLEDIFDYSFYIRNTDVIFEKVFS